MALKTSSATQMTERRKRRGVRSKMNQRGGGTGEEEEDAKTAKGVVPVGHANL